MYYQYRDISRAKRILNGMTKAKLYHSTKDLVNTLSSGRTNYPHKRVRITLENLTKQGYCKEYAVLYGRIKKTDTQNTKILCETKHYKKCVLIIEKSEEWQKAISKKDNIPSRLIFIAIVLSTEELMNLDHGEEFTKMNERCWSLTPKGNLTVLPNISKKELNPFLIRNKKDPIFKMINILIYISQKNHVDALIKKIVGIKKNDAIDVEEIAQSWYNMMKKQIKNLQITNDKYPLLKEYLNQLKHDDVIFISRARKR